MAAHYGQPRRLNAVTVVLILIAMAIAYWFWRFFPAYFDAWNVDHILREGVTSTYQVMRIREPERSKRLKEIVDKTRADVQKQAGITDPNLIVDLNLDGDKAVMSADYHVIVTHPYTTRTTTLHFVRAEKASNKKVEWE
jgi:hypothetical protein